MTRNELVDYLGEVAEAVAQIPKRAPGPDRPDLEFPEEMRSQVERLLRSIPELEDLEEKSLRRISGGGSLSFFRVAISILERLSFGDEPKKIYDDIVDFVTRKSVANFYLAGIGGISLPEKLRLTDQVSIVSAGDISPNLAREFVFRIDRFGSVLGPSHEPLRPQAALMVSNDQPVLFPKKMHSPEERILGMDTIHNLEQKTLFCLTLASERAAPVLTAKTSWIDHPANSYHGLAGGSGGTSPGQQQTSRYDEFDAVLVGELFKSFDCMNKMDRTLLFLAVERLRRSRLHEDPTNRALDLGIALEIIFLHETDNNQELNYRAGIRAAFWLGANEKERSSIRNVVHKAYKARSTAVHEGQLKKADQIGILPEADNLCRQAAIKIVRNGGVPKNFEAIIFADRGSDLR